MTNIFDELPQHLPKELVQTLVQAADVRIERIVSHGHASPEGFWYDQDQNEWVVVLKGAARLRFEDETVEMKPGDFMNIPAHTKHRVEWTTPDEPTIWPALFYGPSRGSKGGNSKVPLPALLVQIATDQHRPLSLVEFVQLVFEAGYKTNAKSVPNLVMTALQKLTAGGTFIKDSAAGMYHVAKRSHSGSDPAKNG